MMLLTLHTSGEEGSVALARCVAEKAEVLSSRTLAPRTFAAGLVPAIHQICEKAGVAWSGVEMLAVVTGPGSFTGIRIGMAAAKGLAEPKRLPIVPVSSLALLAIRLPGARAVLDAGRGEFYAGEFSEHGQACAWERLVNRDEILSMPLSAGHAYVACEPEVAETLAEAGQTVLLSAPPDAATVARWTARHIARENFNPQAFDWTTADGDYLRRPEAEIKLAAAR